MNPTPERCNPDCTVDRCDSNSSFKNGLRSYLSGIRGSTVECGASRSLGRYSFSADHGAGSDILTTNFVLAPTRNTSSSEAHDDEHRIIGRGDGHLFQPEWRSGRSAPARPRHHVPRQFLKDMGQLRQAGVPERRLDSTTRVSR